MEVLRFIGEMEWPDGDSQSATHLNQQDDLPNSRHATDSRQFVITNNSSWCPRMCFDRLLIDGAWQKHSFKGGPALVGMDHLGQQIITNHLSFNAPVAIFVKA